MDKIILAFYINNLDELNIDEIKGLFDKEKYIIIIIPTLGEDKLECVYPKFIACEDTIKRVEESMNELLDKIIEFKNE